MANAECAETLERSSGNFLNIDVPIHDGLDRIHPFIFSCHRWWLSTNACYDCSPGGSELLKKIEEKVERGNNSSALFECGLRCSSNGGFSDRLFHRLRKLNASFSARRMVHSSVPSAKTSSMRATLFSLHFPRQVHIPSVHLQLACGADRQSCIGCLSEVFNYESCFVIMEDCSFGCIR